MSRNTIVDMRIENLEKRIDHLERMILNSSSHRGSSSESINTELLNIVLNMVRQQAQPPPPPQPQPQQQQPSVTTDTKSSLPEGQHHATNNLFFARRRVIN